MSRLSSRPEGPGKSGQDPPEREPQIEAVTTTGSAACAPAGAPQREFGLPPDLESPLWYHYRVRLTIKG